MKEHLFEDAYVTVTQGILHGTVENGIKVFRGVPYAASPVGDRRWKAPLPPARWFGVRKWTPAPVGKRTPSSSPPTWTARTAST